MIVTDEQPIPLGRRPKYDWDKWTNGEQHTIEQGKDFSLRIHSMRAQLHVKASTLGMKVETRLLEGDKLAFQFSTPTEETSSK